MRRCGCVEFVSAVARTVKEDVRCQKDCMWNNVVVLMSWRWVFCRKNAGVGS